MSNTKTRWMRAAMIKRGAYVIATSIVNITNRFIDFLNYSLFDLPMLDGDFIRRYLP